MIMEGMDAKHPKPTNRFKNFDKKMGILRMFFLIFIKLCTFEKYINSFVRVIPGEYRE